MTDFLIGNGWQHRLARTVVQGLLAVIAANIDLLLGSAIFDPEWRALSVALVMAVLSPVMALLGEAEAPGEDVDGGR